MTKDTFWATPDETDELHAGDRRPAHALRRAGPGRGVPARGRAPHALVRDEPPRPTFPPAPGPEAPTPPTRPPSRPSRPRTRRRRDMVALTYDVRTVRIPSPGSSSPSARAAEARPSPRRRAVAARRARRAERRRRRPSRRGTRGPPLTDPARPDRGRPAAIRGVVGDEPSVTHPTRRTTDPMSLLDLHARSDGALAHATRTRRAACCRAVGHTGPRGARTGRGRRAPLRRVPALADVAQGDDSAFARALRRARPRRLRHLPRRPAGPGPRRRGRPGGLGRGVAHRRPVRRRPAAPPAPGP